MGSVGNPPASVPIAIIGLSCKFAGDAESPAQLWRMLAERRSAGLDVPSSRLNLPGFIHPDPLRHDSTVCVFQDQKEVHVQGPHLLQQNIAQFDASFFNLTSEVVVSLDPDVRLQLESVYEALENAGLPLAEMAGSDTTVFASVGKDDYRDRILHDAQTEHKALGTGPSQVSAATAISQFFDLRGASVTLNPAGSTSLVTLHQAVQSLRSGEASTSIVGASNLILNSGTFMSMGSSGIWSTADKSRSRSDLGRGEGVATLVLKRLEDALAAGDPVRAVIREILVKHCGRTEMTSTAGRASQAALIRDCYSKAGLDPQETQYVETHRINATFAGSSEASALYTVFQPTETRPLHMGSVTSNVGHTGVTSGLAGIIKVIVAMENGLIPPSADLNETNPAVVPTKARLKVVTEPEKWPLGPSQCRRASVHYICPGGPNSHAILESADSVQSHVQGPPPSGKYKTKVLVLSAKTERACVRLVSRLKDYLESKTGVANDEALLENVMYTLGQRRTLFPWTAAHRVPFSQGIAKVTEALCSPQFHPAHASRSPRVGMVFTGQGASWHAMGRELIIAYPNFKSSLEDGEMHLKGLGADWSLLQELQRDVDTTKVNDSAMSIPICVALQISLVRLLRSWGVNPTAVVSHSSGEIAAAYAVGALSYKAAMVVAYYYAALTTDKASGTDASSKGGMVAIGAGVGQTESYLSQLQGGKAVIACINSPLSTTVAGDAAAVQELEVIAKNQGVFARQLHVDTAYHSHHMDPIAEQYREVLHTHKIQPERDGNAFKSTDFFSAVTGGRIDSIEELARPEHWVKSLTQPVRFSDAVSDVLLGDLGAAGTTVDILIEVGPHAALGGPIREIVALPDFDDIHVSYYSCLVRETNARDSMQDLVANLVREGYVAVDLGSINFPWGKWPHVHVLTDLPSYPWDHQKQYWHKFKGTKALCKTSQPHHPLLGFLEPRANPLMPSWRQVLQLDAAPWVVDQSIGFRTMYPVTGFLCRAIEAASQMIKLQDGLLMSKSVKGYQLQDIKIQHPLFVPDNAEGIEIQTSLHPASNADSGLQNWMRFVISSVTTADATWTHHVTGIISVDCGGATEMTTRPYAAVRGEPRDFGVADFYTSMQAVGCKYGRSFQNIKRVVRWPESCLSETSFAVSEMLVSTSGPSADYVLHPTTLDSAIQAAYTALSEAQLRQGRLKFPQAIARLWASKTIPSEPGHRFKAHSSRCRGDDTSLEANVLVVDDEDETNNNGKCVLMMEGLVLGAAEDEWIPGGARPQPSKPWDSEIVNTLNWTPASSLATVATTTRVMLDKVVLISSSSATPPPSWLESLRRSIASDMGPDTTLPTVEILESSAASVYTGKICVFLGEASRPMLRNLEASEFAGIKAMVASCKGLLWLTRGGAIDCEQPDHGLAVGLIRTLRNEYVGRKFLALDVDPKRPVWTPATAAAILQILRAEFASSIGAFESDGPQDFEYAERDGRILVPRLQKHLAANRMVVPEPLDGSTETARPVAEISMAPTEPVASSRNAKNTQAPEELAVANGAINQFPTTGTGETASITPTLLDLELSPGSSYLIVGGFGGIGRSVVAWMATHGAKNLIVLSRHAGDSPKAGGFVAQIMRETGCHIKAISCDVSSAVDLFSVLQECQMERLPPIRGVVQAAMARQDSVLAQMTLENFNAAIQPAVLGTWNLHTHFPRASDLAFFIILSAATGTLGHASQANYAASATYQDALARWRVRKGLPCVCIDLPVVKEIGHNATTTKTAATGQVARDRMARLGHLLLDEETVLRLVEWGVRRPYDGQIVAGINTRPGPHWDLHGPAQLGRDARFGPLQQPNTSSSGGGGGDGNSDSNGNSNGNSNGDANSGNDTLPRQLAAVSSRQTAERLVGQAIAQKLADLLRVPVHSGINMETQPGAHGVDSLVAAELRDMLRRHAGADLSSFDIMQSASLAALARLAAARSEFVGLE